MQCSGLPQLGAEALARAEAAPGPETTRLIVRLEHSLEEGEEIHAVLPDTLHELEEALARDNPTPRPASTKTSFGGIVALGTERG